MPVETPCHSSKASILSKERTPKQHMLQQSSASRSEREANDKGDNRMDSGEMFSPRSAAAMALSSISQQNQIPGQAQMKESNAQKQASPDLTKHAGATAEHYIADGVLPPPLPPQPSQAPEPRKKKNLKESFAAEQFDRSSLPTPAASARQPYNQPVAPQYAHPHCLPAYFALPGPPPPSLHAPPLMHPYNGMAPYHWHAPHHPIMLPPMGRQPYMFPQQQMSATAHQHYVSAVSRRGNAPTVE